jgi:hypothetical protein
MTKRPFKIVIRFSSVKSRSATRFRVRRRHWEIGPVIENFPVTYLEDLVALAVRGPVEQLPSSGLRCAGVARGVGPGWRDDRRCRGREEGQQPGRLCCEEPHDPERARVVVWVGRRGW